MNNSHNSNCSLEILTLSLNHLKLIRGNEQITQYGFGSAKIRMVNEIVQDDAEIIEEIDLFIEDGGRREAQFIKTTKKMTQSDSIETSMKRRTIDPQHIITHTRGEKQAYRRPNHGASLIKDMSQQETNQLAGRIYDAMETNFTDLGEKLVAGKNSTCREVKKKVGLLTLVTTECLYKGFVMESQTVMDGQTISTEKVLSFEEEASINASIWQFSVPIQDAAPIVIKKSN